MDSVTYKILNSDIIKSQVLFSINDDIQIVFRTDANTAEKLEDDDILKSCLEGLIQKDVLSCYGIRDPEQINTLNRLDAVDENKTIVSLGIAPTELDNGVEELHCFVIDERLLLEEEDPITVDSSGTWTQAQQVPELAADSGPTLRWSSEMTSLLIQIRGDMDLEFNRAKYKFRLWEKLATQLNSNLLTTRVSAKDCDDKWRNIVATYRKNIDKIRTLGDNSVRWEYFNAMDNILKGTKEMDFSNEHNTGEQMVRLINELNQHPEPTSSRFSNDGIEVVDISGDAVTDDEMVGDEESLQNRIITRKSNEDKRIWTTEMCLTLLYLRLQAESKFQSNFDKVHLWKDLADEMNLKFLTDFNADEVESVWKYCVMTYDTNLENLKSKGVNAVKWKYFAVMDDIRGGTFEISDICVPRPGEELLKKFHEIKSNSQLIDSSFTDNILSFTSRKPGSMKDSDSEDATFAANSTLWTKDMVKTLIFLRKQINEDLACNKISRKKQWLVMVRRFRALKNIRLTEEACEDKWRNLMRTYKKNLLRVKNRGATVKWPFFWPMREVVGNSVLQMDTDRRLFGDVSSSRISTVSTCAKNATGISDDYDDDDMFDDRLDTLLNSVNDLRQSQNRMSNEIDTQKKVLQEVQKEQNNIKCLLTQLLKKFT